MESSKGVDVGAAKLLSPSMSMKDVVECGVEMFRSGQLDEDTVMCWDAKERLFLALLHQQHDSALADEILKKICSRFPNSARASRLGLLQSESRLSPDDAIALYRKQGPADVFARRRIFCVLRCAERTQEALEELRSLLDDFGGDSALWSEAADFFLEKTKDFESAVFCGEEALASNPESVGGLCAVGEMLWKWGKKTEGKKYFCRAAELSEGGSKEALEGIVKCGEGEEDEIVKWAKERLEEK